MLKQAEKTMGIVLKRQPPSGGCVLKHIGGQNNTLLVDQPPSGGCVLKPTILHRWI